MEEEQKIVTPKKRRIGKSQIHFWVMIPIVLGMIALLVYAHQWKSHLVVQRVIVNGATHLQAREVVELSTIKPQSLINDIDIHKIEETLLSHPLIKTAKVESQLPDAMRIVITEREPFAVVSGKPLMYVDSDGVLLPRLPALQFDLPIVIGVEGVDTMQLGRQIPKPEMFLAIAVLKQAQSVGWYHSISEIKVESDGQIMLLSMDSGVPIFIGKSDIGNKLQRLQTFWKNYVKDGTAAQLRYLDLRFDGQVVVKWDRPKDPITRIPL